VPFDPDFPYDDYIEALSATYGWKVGHVLTADDIAALALIDRHSRMHEDGLTDTYHRGYQDGLRHAGGTDVQALANKNDVLNTKLSVERGLRQMERQWGFREGAQRMREMLARFTEQGGAPIIANSLRLNWNPQWGDDPGEPPEHDDSPAFPRKEPA
jgi:hypothetical protein